MLKIKDDKIAELQIYIQNINTMTREGGTVKEVYNKYRNKVNMKSDDMGMEMVALCIYIEKKKEKYRLKLNDHL